MKLIGYCVAYKSDPVLTSGYKSSVASDIHPNGEIFLNRDHAVTVLAAERLKCETLEYLIVEVYA